MGDRTVVPVKQGWLTENLSLPVALPIRWSDVALKYVCELRNTGKWLIWVQHGMSSTSHTGCCQLGVCVTTTEDSNIYRLCAKYFLN